MSTNLIHKIIAVVPVFRDLIYGKVKSPCTN